MYDGTQATEGEVLHLLTALVLVHKPEVVVETGTFNGHGTQAIQAGLKSNDKGHLWTVENNAFMTRQYAEMELDRVTFVDADSLEWAEEAKPWIDLAFVDCGEPEHRLTVLRTLALKTRGILALHDTSFYPELEEMAIGAIGPPALSLPVVNGLLIWKV